MLTSRPVLLISAKIIFPLAPDDSRLQVKLGCSIASEWMRPDQHNRLACFCQLFGCLLLVALTHHLCCAERGYAPYVPRPYALKLAAESLKSSKQQLLEGVDPELLRQLPRLLGQAGLSDAAYKRAARCLRLVVLCSEQHKTPMLNELESELHKCVGLPPQCPAHCVTQSLSRCTSNACHLGV